MIDVKLPLRTAYYQLLNGAIIYNATAIPISTDLRKLADNAALTYIIIRAQTGIDKSTLNSFDSQEEIFLDIVNKAKTRVNNEIIENISNQIFGLVLPSVKANGLPAQPGIQIACVQLSGDRYLDLVLNSSTTAMRRILTFTQKVRQTGS